MTGRSEAQARRPLRVSAFFYGSYMDPQVLKRFGAAPGKGRPASLPGWRLTFSPHANLVRDPKATVQGFLFELSHEELDALYGPTGFVTTYRPVPVLVQTEAKDMAAITYVEDAPEARPEPEYLEALLGICRRLGLPAGYCDSLQERADALEGIAA